jgi:hypothetical protein
LTAVWRGYAQRREYGALYGAPFYLWAEEVYAESLRGEDSLWESAVVESVLVVVESVVESVDESVVESVDESAVESVDESVDENVDENVDEEVVFFFVKEVVVEEEEEVVFLFVKPVEKRWTFRRFDLTARRSRVE